MKLFASILILYVLALAVMPCPDAANDNAMHKTEQSSEPHDNHHNDIGHCSPFCTCSCCASPVIYQPLSIDLNCFEYTTKEYLNHNTDFNSLLYTSIWQPPKLS